MPTLRVHAIKAKAQKGIIDATSELRPDGTRQMLLFSKKSPLKMAKLRKQVADANHELARRDLVRAQLKDRGRQVRKAAILNPNIVK